MKLTQTEMIHLRKVQDLSKLLGKRLVKKSKKPVEIEYDNGVTYLQVNTQLDMDDLDLAIHNLGHFICASPFRRFLPDFGLGRSPDTKLSIPSLIPEEDAEYEEAVTGYLSGIIHKYIGTPLANHNHQIVNREKYKATLLAWGVIDENENLTLKLRQTPDQCFVDRAMYILDEEGLFKKFYSEKVLAEAFAQK